MTPPKKKHTLSALVENKFGVLARVAGMLSGRGFNIETLNVGPTHDPAFSASPRPSSPTTPPSTAALRPSRS